MSPEVFKALVTYGPLGLFAGVAAVVIRALYTRNENNFLAQLKDKDAQIAELKRERDEERANSIALERELRLNVVPLLERVNGTNAEAVKAIADTEARNKLLLEQIAEQRRRNA